MQTTKGFSMETSLKKEDSHLSWPAQLQTAAVSGSGALSLNATAGTCLCPHISEMYFERISIFVVLPHFSFFLHSKAWM